MLLSELLTWLVPLEEEAEAAYRAAANACPADPALAAFLRRLARDEVEHQKLLQRAGHLLTETGADRPASILVDDDQARHHILQPLQDLEARARTHTLTEADVLPAVVQAEFSEFNPIFLYVLGQFRQQAPIFQHVAAVVQQHQQRIREFLAGLPEERRPPAALAGLPRVWDRRLLVVDDDDGLRLALEAFLSDLGQVTTASNGQEALARTREQFFDVIISDVSMPVMNGLAFHQALASSGSPERGRFIFCTGDQRPEIAQLCAANKARLIAKPFTFTSLRATVSAVLDHQP